MLPTMIYYLLHDSAWVMKTKRDKEHFFVFDPGSSM